MIDKAEIEGKAEQIGVSHANVERDYVFGWLLKAFYENEYLAALLVFKGGNCMRKAYYPETRFSSDLDFSVESAIDVPRMQTEINKACLAAQGACGVQFETERNVLRPELALDNERQSFKGRIYFKDFYGNSDNITISVRLDLTEFDRLYLPTVKRPLLHHYSDTSECRVDLRCMALEELLANKLKCLIQRRHSFDLYDLVYAAFFERSIEVDRGLVLRTFLRKTIFEPSPNAAREILLGLPMPFFKAAWDRYVAPISSRFTFEDAEKGFRDVIDAIFHGINAHRWGEEPFFPSQYRNTILEAGAGRRVLAVVYDDGRERLVEPYALAYKRRRDRQGAEYFYVWDQTGGTSSGPGIKTFVHHKIRKLEMTEEVFEPRYPIELAKAGEKASKDYFGKEFSEQVRSGSRKSLAAWGTRTGRARRVSAPSAFGVTYRVECPYCRKRFTRDRPTTALNPHKNDYGGPCPGRVGYLVW
jgi:predicted nucleotidyltransferase component of viral defense system